MEQCYHTPARPFIIIYSLPPTCITIFFENNTPFQLFAIKRKQIKTISFFFLFFENRKQLFFSTFERKHQKNTYLLTYIHHLLTYHNISTSQFLQMIANESKDELCQNSVINIHFTSLIIKQKKKKKEKNNLKDFHNTFSEYYGKRKCSINNRHN